MMLMSQEDLESLANNPQRGINLVINEIENNFFNGTVTLNSKSHPAVLMIDLILAGDHGFLNRLGDAVSQVFMQHARDVEDLSRSMADDQRFGLFASPANSVMRFAIDVDTFQKIAKDYTATVGRVTTSGKKLLIPKDSTFDVNGYSFANNNGVEIRYSEKTGYQAVYDEETNNPFSPITTNLLHKDFKIVNDRKYLLVDVPVLQLNIKPAENITSNEGTGCRGSLTYEDYLYGVRAFLVKGGVMKEILVTYDQDVFDPLTVTMTLGIDTVNNRIKYEIPDVYIANRLGVGSIRIYTYTTKGELVKDLRDTPTGTIAPLYQDLRLGAGKLGEYSDLLRNSGGMAWVMADVTSGGKNPTSFAEMKQNLINDRRSRAIPITENNLEGSVEEYGYSAVKTIDFLTRRSYSISKELPRQDNKNFYAPMSCYVGSHLSSANDLVSAGVVWDNGKRITIPHDVLFDVTNPTTKLVNQIQKAAYQAMNNPQLVEATANNTLVYTPFYYVMDMSNNQAVLRTYHLDEPVVNKQVFIAENSSLGLELGVGSIKIDHRDTGYVLTVISKSSTAYKNIDHDQIGLQLSISPQDTSSLASMVGTLVAVTEDQERVWEFSLGSSFDIDVNDVIYFNSFTQFGKVQPSTGTKLNLVITLIFTVTGDKEYTKFDSDALIEQSLFREPMVAIIETRYDATLGKRLGNLYSRIRPVIGEAQYQRYTADVPDTYESNKYKYVNGEMVFDEFGAAILEHKAGDIIYNTDGTVRLLHRANIDIVYKNGKPLELAPRDLKYHWDFIAFDGNYFFSTDPYDITFAQATKDYFVNVVSKDMEGFTSRSLDRTSLFYQPRSKLGYQKVVVNNNFESSLKQDLKFTVTYYLTAAGYANQNLKDSLTTQTPKVINETLFNSTTIGISNFITALLANTGPEVVSAKISALSGDTTVDVISNVDSLTGFSVAKELQLSGDGGLSIKESIDTIFMQHDIRSTEFG